MSIVEEAFQQLYRNNETKYNFSLKYSRKFKPYNANVKRYGSNLVFSLSKEWKKISKEIQIGLVQELLVKTFNDKKQTINMELYNLFIKNIHLAVPKTKTDEVLEASFERVNEAYFNGMLEKPNLQWGNASTSKLGSYEYGSDTITISTIFKNERRELLDYVIHHEMLHKKFKFQSKNGRNVHHSNEFRRMEAKFENHDLMEKDISKLARKYRFGSKLFLNF
ncbi:SprT-like domain-containing protein [Candidatus Woesearchaeota archaeon]|nr:SprT-like domain-containing protein [Candidatus Woesearchaeota archaeon]